jgi:hypothetical protein
MEGGKLNDDALCNDKYMDFQNTVMEFLCCNLREIGRFSDQMFHYQKRFSPWSWIIILFKKQPVREPNLRATYGR